MLRPNARLPKVFVAPSCRVAWSDITLVDASGAALASTTSKGATMIEPRHWRRWTAAAWLALALSGCVFSARPRWQTAWNDPWRQGWLDPGTPVVAQPPPPSIDAHVGPVGAHASGQVWVDGHHEWMGGNYQWIQGHWSNPPQPGWEWQQPVYHHGQWHRGHWHAPGQPVPPAYAIGVGVGGGGLERSGPVAQPVYGLSTNGSMQLAPATSAVATPVQ
jgi:hypothetical protein